MEKLQIGLPNKMYPGPKGRKGEKNTRRVDHPQRSPRPTICTPSQKPIFTENPPNQRTQIRTTKRKHPRASTRPRTLVEAPKTPRRKINQENRSQKNPPNQNARDKLAMKSYRWEETRNNSRWVPIFANRASIHASAARDPSSVESEE